MKHLLAALVAFVVAIAPSLARDDLDSREIERHGSAEEKARLGDARFEDDAITDSLHLLASKHLTDRLDGEGTRRLVGATRAYLAEVVRGGGNILRDAALRRLERGTLDERVRAQFVLGHATAIPELVRRRLQHSGSLETRAWATLSEPGFTSVSAPPPNPAFFRRPRPGEADPLADCADAIADRFRRTEAELATLKPEYVEAYRTVLLPNLERLPELTTIDGRYGIDIDGDGTVEWLVHATIPDGWNRGPVFVALLREAAGRWEIAWCETVDPCDLFDGVVIDDLDLDGRAEVVVMTTVLGAGAWPDLQVLDEQMVENPLARGGKTAGFLRNPHDGRLVLYGGSAYRPGGGYGNSSVTLGMRYSVLQLEPDGRRTEAVVYVTD